jgi:hypothetical protein
MLFTASLEIILLCIISRPSRWDEWIAWDSPRLAPFRSRTIHNTQNGTVSPAPVSNAPQAPRTGIDDIRTLIPELSNMLQLVSPIAEQAATLSVSVC